MVYIAGFASGISLTGVSGDAFAFAAGGVVMGSFLTDLDAGFLPARTSFVPLVAPPGRHPNSVTSDKDKIATRLTRRCERRWRCGARFIGKSFFLFYKTNGIEPRRLTKCGNLHGRKTGRMERLAIMWLAAVPERIVPNAADDTTAAEAAGATFLQDAPCEMQAARTPRRKQRAFLAERGISATSKMEGASALQFERGYDHPANARHQHENRHKIGQKSGDQQYDSGDQNEHLLRIQPSCGVGSDSMRFATASDHRHW